LKQGSIGTHSASGKRLIEVKGSGAYEGSQIMVTTFL